MERGSWRPGLIAVDPTWPPLVSFLGKSHFPLNVVGGKTHFLKVTAVKRRFVVCSCARHRHPGVTIPLHHL